MKTTLDILNIWISPGHDFRGHHGKERGDHGVEARESVQCVAGQGIEGDRYFGYKEDFKGQITFISADVADQLQEALALPDFDRSAMRRNVLVSGVDLNTLIGKQFRIGEVVFRGSEECSPCYWMDEAVGKGAHQFLKGNGGLRCRIESTGRLSTGSHELEIL
ncbi:MAG: MOSC domain-containing protein [Puniceicoccaceae bacterium]